MPDWLHAPDYWIARLVLQRGLAFVYLIAFAVTLGQFRPLLGEHGLLPVPRYLATVRFRDAPSLFHVRYSDRLLVAVAVTGIALSLAALLGFPDDWPVPATIAVWLALWVLYLSIVNVGQTFYSFGWETLLLEAGFLAAFLGPAWSAVPAPLVWLFRWLLFRLEFGAGLIKLRGDSCWRDLTCLYYHHETQPMPNALSWYFHHLPKALHRIEVAGNHVAQLVAPALLFAPQPIAALAGLVMALTQGWLVASGNFSWLNVLTIVLTASAFDDAALEHLLPLGDPGTHAVEWHDGVVIALGALVVALSYRPARNLLSREQAMNASFEPLHLVNTYGAFGSITRERHEVVLEGTSEARIGPDTVWREYEFRGKPGDPKRRPSQWAPYHLRLDWLMWFAALSPSYAHPWLGRLVGKLLQNEPSTLRLLRQNPFPQDPPRVVRAVLYHYRFTTWRERRAAGTWWARTRLGEYLPPMALREDPRHLTAAPHGCSVDSGGHMDVREDRKRRLAAGGVRKPRQLAHVVRRTSRFDELVRWYCTVLGAEVVHSDGRLAFLTYDDEHHRIAIAGIPGLEEQPAMAAGTDHVAFTLADLGDLLHTFRRLKAIGIEPYWCINHGPTTSLYYKDPDGSRIELQVDNLPTAESIDAWMRSGDFAANPIGVVFDPEELVARYEAGEPIETLTARPRLPEGVSPFEMLRL